MKRKYLYLIAALIWGVPGIIITAKGWKAYTIQSLSDGWWLMLVTIVVGVAFFHMFRRIVDRYSTRIASLQEDVSVWQTFSLRGWMLLLFMMGLGLALRIVPYDLSAFTASFYSGLGPMLLFSSFRFLQKGKSEEDGKSGI